MKEIKAWAIITSKGNIKEWHENGSGLRILKTKRQAEEYFKDRSSYAIYPAKGSRVVECIIIIN